MADDRVRPKGEPVLAPDVCGPWCPDYDGLARPRDLPRTLDADAVRICRWCGRVFPVVPRLEDEDR